MITSRIKQAIVNAQKSVSPKSENVSCGSATLSRALIHLDDWAEPEAGVAEHQAFCAQSGIKCIVISNRMAPGLLQNPDVIFEFAPLDICSVHDGWAGGGLARQYLMDRLINTVAFWKVVGCSWEGNRSSEVRDALERTAPPESVFAATSVRNL